MCGGGILEILKCIILLPKIKFNSSLSVPLAMPKCIEIYLVVTKTTVLQLLCMRPRKGLNKKRHRKGTFFPVALFCITTSIVSFQLYFLPKEGDGWEVSTPLLDCSSGILNALTPLSQSDSSLTELSKTSLCRLEICKHSLSLVRNHT